MARILNHCRYPLHTGQLEGINNKIKLIKRMAYGFRDETYFFLKIRFLPENPRCISRYCVKNQIFKRQAAVGRR